MSQFGKKSSENRPVLQSMALVLKRDLGESCRFDAFSGENMQFLMHFEASRCVILEEYDGYFAQMQ